MAFHVHWRGEIRATVLLALPIVFGIGLLTSIGVVVSREHGAGNLNARPRILRAAFWLSVSLGTCLVVVINTLKPCLGVWFHPPAVVLEAAQPYLSVVGWSLLPATGYLGAKIFCEALNRPLAPMWFLFGG
jgi:Na+-driven multidrug efflux pump